MENDGVWRMASARGKSSKSRQPIKNGDVRQNGVLHDAKVSPVGNKDSGYNGSSTAQNNVQQRNSIYKTTQNNKPPTTTVAASTYTSGSSQNGFSDPKKSLEKEIKSLARHESSIERARWLFNEEMIKSEDRLKRAFIELRDLLNQREQKLSTELDLCKSEGLIMLDNRDEMGRQLRTQTERAAKMSDKELHEIRQNVRKLVNERKLEDDIGKTLRFQYEPDKLIEFINSFGEVVPVNQAPRKSSSVNSLISADSADVSVASSDAGKALNQVMIGGLLIQSDSMDTSQLADLTRQLQESLKMQGITDDIIPEVSGSMGSMPQRRRPGPGPASAPTPSSRGGASKRGGGGGGNNRR